MSTRTNDRAVGRPWLLVTRREIMAKVTNKAFLLGTLVTVAMIAAYMAFIAYQANATEEFTIAVAPQERVVADAVSERAGELDDSVTIKVREVASEAAATEALREGKADAWLHPNGEGWDLTYESSDDSTLTRIVSQTVQEWTIASRAEAAGTTMADLQAGSVVTEQFLRGDAEKAEVAEVMGFAFAFLFYLATILFGMQLANSVVEEKQSRIVEIIAAAIPLRHLLAGKVLGNTILAVLQVILYAAVGLVGLSFTEYSAIVPSLSGPVVWFLVFFLLGFGALATLWAVAGSLASRTEDLQSTATPLTMLLVVLFIVALQVDGQAKVIASYVPPASAIVMPQRILEGSVGWWQPVVAIALLAAFAGVMIVVGERIYRRSLLQTQGRVSLKQAWASEE